MAAFWMLANCKNGVSSYELHRALGVRQQTAWFMLHRIREAMKEDSSINSGWPAEVGRKRRNIRRPEPLQDAQKPPTQIADRFAGNKDAEMFTLARLQSRECWTERIAKSAQGSSERSARYLAGCNLECHRPRQQTLYRRPLHTDGLLENPNSYTRWSIMPASTCVAQFTRRELKISGRSSRGRCAELTLLSSHSILIVTLTNRYSVLTIALRKTTR